MRNIYSILIAMIVVSSCSFQSAQYQLIKDTISDSEESLKPQKNWSILWRDKKIDLYAINLEEHIIFADERIRVFFSSNQIYQVIGLLEDNLQVRANGEEQQFLASNTIIDSASCGELSLSIINTSVRKFSRNCLMRRSKEVYTNEVYVNEDNQIFQLKFKIHPSYPSIELKNELAL